MEIADVFGYLGIFTGIAFMIPQVWKTWQTKSAEDISWGMLVLFFLNCVFWFAYGMLSDAFPVALVNSVGFVIVSVLIVLKILYRNNP
jgi:MtN3 and saliva related transmembrane protein